MLCLDKLTYACNLNNLALVAGHLRYRFSRADICDAAAMRAVFAAFRPDIVMHLAAESHVDRSIDGPGSFDHANVVGTFTLLQAARRHWAELGTAARERFCFHDISNDEVFGSLGATGLFTEDSLYRPNSL